MHFLFISNHAMYNFNNLFATKTKQINKKHSKKRSGNQDARATSVNFSHNRAGWHQSVVAGLGEALWLIVKGLLDPRHPQGNCFSMLITSALCPRTCVAKARCDCFLFDAKRDSP